MITEYLYTAALVAIICLAVVTFYATSKQANPYGRYANSTDRHTLPARPAWLIFESPQWWAFALTFWLTAQSPGASAVVLFALWQSHYVYRAIVYPLRRNDKGKRFPTSGVVFGLAFNALNGFVNGYAVTHAAHLDTPDWLTDPRFIIGLLIAVSGWLINFQADNILIKLRGDGSAGYAIPRGGAFRWVSAANYFGELVLWTGWALMSWTFAGLLFAVFTAANLGPRAISYHKWYLKTFPDYPPDRKALIPRIL